MGKLKEKVAVITAALRDTGCYQRALVRKGPISSSCRRPEQATSAVAATGSNVTGVQGDVAKTAI